MDDQCAGGSGGSNFGGGSHGLPASHQAIRLHSQGCSVETATAIQTSLGHTFGALNMYLILCYEDVTCKL